MNKIIYILIFLFISSFVYSNQKAIFCSNNINSETSIKLTFFSFNFDTNKSIKMKDKKNIGSQFIKPLKFFGYAPLGLVVISTFLLVVGIIGLVGIVIGIPLLSVGLYCYSYLNEQNILNRNLIISGAVTLGTGLLCSIPFIIWLSIFGRIIASEAVEKYHNERRGSPLIIAIRNGNINKVKQLIEENCDINEKNSDNYTSFDAAVYWNRYEIAKLLLDHGAKIDFSTRDIYIDVYKEKRISSLAYTKFNVFEESVRNENTDMMKLLIDSGADIYMKNIFGSNILMMVVNSYNKKFVFDAINLLLSYGIDINDKNLKDNKTVLHYLLSMEYRSKNKDTIDIVKLLIEKGIDFNAKDNNNKTPLDYAIEKGNNEIIDFLKQNGAKTGVELNQL